MEKVPDEELRRTATGRRHSAARERLLRELETRPHASIAELVEILGLHENTVRAHLDALRRDGHVRRERAHAAGRGRPAWRWQAVSPTALSPYAGLAATLAAALTRASEDPAATARAAGGSWGRQLVGERAPVRREPITATELIIDVMREQGFAPETEERTSDRTGARRHDAVNGGDERGLAVRLHACPLLSAAAENPAVVCAVHEGMIEGIARAVGSDLTGRLTPFADADSCLLHLRTPA